MPSGTIILPKKDTNDVTRKGSHTLRAKHLTRIDKQIRIYDDFASIKRKLIGESTNESSITDKNTSNPKVKCLSYYFGFIKSPLITNYTNKLFFQS